MFFEWTTEFVRSENLKSDVPASDTDCLTLTSSRFAQAENRSGPTTTQLTADTKQSFKSRHTVSSLPYFNSLSHLHHFEYGVPISAGCWYAEQPLQAGSEFVSAYAVRRMQVKHIICKMKAFACGLDFLQRFQGELGAVEDRKFRCRVLASASG